MLVMHHLRRRSRIAAEAQASSPMSPGSSLASPLKSISKIFGWVKPFASARPGPTDESDKSRPAAGPAAPEKSLALVVVKPSASVGQMIVKSSVTGGAKIAQGFGSSATGPPGLPDQRVLGSSMLMTTDTSSHPAPLKESDYADYVAPPPARWAPLSLPRPADGINPALHMTSPLRTMTGRSGSCRSAAALASAPGQIVRGGSGRSAAAPASAPGHSAFDSGWSSLPRR